MGVWYGVSTHVVTHILLLMSLTSKCTTLFYSLWFTYSQSLKGRGRGRGRGRGGEGEGEGEGRGGERAGRGGEGRGGEGAGRGGEGRGGAVLFEIS